MTGKEDFNFDFDDNSFFDKIEDDDTSDFSFELDEPPESLTQEHTEPKAVRQKETIIKKRTSRDFEKDMDILLITAQSSMIIEGLEYLTDMNFSSKTLSVYTEAIRGVDLHIKILQRDPANYKKLSKIFKTDIDCQKIEQLTINIYKNIYNEEPGTDDQLIRAFEIVKGRLQDGYRKALISRSMVQLKEYFLMSGGLDETKIIESIKCNPKGLGNLTQNFAKNIEAAIKFLKEGKGEMTKGMKGKDMNIFIIKASQLLTFYYQTTKQTEAVKYYSRLNNNYKKYFIIR